MANVISIAAENSLEFIKVQTLGNDEGQLPFNTLVSEQVHANLDTMCYAQFVRQVDIITTQVKTDWQLIYARVVDEYGVNVEGLVVTKKTDYPSAYTPVSFWEFDFQGLGKNGFYQIEVTFVDPEYGLEQYISEPILVQDDFTEYYNDEFIPIVIKWERRDTNTQFMDYSTGIVNKMLVLGRISEYAPLGEVDVYDNQGTEVKLYEENKESFIMRVENVPWYIARRIKTALSTDYVLINGQEFVTEDNPEIEPIEGTTNYNIESTIITAFAVGLNTDDQGYTCEATEPVEGTIMNVQRLTNRSGSIQFSIPDGYIVAYIIVEKRTGTGNALINAGFSPSPGDDLIKDWSVAVADVQHAPQNNDFSESTTLYCDISGVGVTVDISVTSIPYIPS